MAELPESDPTSDGIVRRLARYRVRLGFVAARWRALAGASRRRGASRPARRLPRSGKALRIWAAGHLEKGREVTVSGPYR